MAEPRWLSDDEQQVWRLYLEASQRLWSRLGKDLGDETDVSMAEYDVLVKLSEAPERTLRMSDLASYTTLSRSRIAHTVTRMEKAGLVERAKTDVDGRGVTATLTPEGVALLESAAPPHVDSVRRHFIDLLSPEELGHLHGILAKMAEHLRAVDKAANR